jgi:alpha-D-xyloside xylohydrolase
MKFSHGAWLWESNVTPSCVRRVYEHQIEAGVLDLAALDRLGTAGEDRFEGLILQLRITSPLPDVIRVKVSHHLGAQQHAVHPELAYELSAQNIKIDDHPDQLLFTSGRLTLSIRKSNFKLTFLDGDAVIATSGRDGLGHMRVDHPNGQQTSHLMQRLSLGIGECIYGLGERFGPLVKNGQSVSIWNEDGGTSSDLAYKNIPFYLSSRGYGLLVNSTAKVEFEIGTERVSQLQFSVPQEQLDYYFFLGPDPKDILDKYTQLAGRAAVPPAWSFGLWLSTSFTTQYDDKTVNEFIDGMARHKIPLNVFHFDCFWMKERHWCDFQWDRKAFPDPEGMLKRMKAKGLKICLWINPYISQLSELFVEGSRGGFLLKRADGSVFQRDRWQPGMALVDFTNPQAIQWYCAKLTALLDMGVDCFKTDFGELIPTDVVYHNAADPQQMHNHYAYLYNKAVFELLERYHGKGNAMVFARSASIGSQKFPVHWGGDCDATFEAMAEDLRGGLSFCMSGPAFWSHDIGGFSGKADPAVYKRWIAFGLLSSHSRLHGSESYRVPWLFDEESVDVLRHFTRLKNQLFPYLFATAQDAHERGWPMMRAMPLEFPDDPACRYLDRQYMLGSSLLVAPIFRRDNIAQYYVPPGSWTDLLTGQISQGGRWRTDEFDFMRLPLLVKENSIVPMGMNEEQPAWDLADKLILKLFQIREGADINLRIPAGDSAAHFRCRREGQKITLESDGTARRPSVFLASTRNTGRISNGKPLAQQPDGLLIEWTDPSKPMSIVLAE